MNINFYLERKKTKDREKLIWCYIRERGKSLCLSTGERIDPKYWDKKTKTANIRKGRDHETKALLKEQNQYLASFENKILSIARSVRFKETNANFNSIVEAINEHFKKSKNSFYSIYEDFLLYQASRITPQSQSKYKRLKSLLEEFETDTGFVIKLDSINQHFHDKFFPYLIEEKNMVNNSAYKIISFLKAFMNWAYERNLTSNSSYKGFKSRATTNDVLYLSEIELMKLYNLNLESDKLQRVRDIFCFQCFTGVRYSDLERFEWSDLKGTTWHLRTKKTKDPLQIPLSDLAMSILHKYSDWELPLPIISNQKANKYVKELCKKAKLNESIKTYKYKGNREEIEVSPKYELVGTHTARRTFISLSLRKGMSPDVIMSITGHKTYRMMQKYLKIADEYKKEEMDKVWGSPLKRVK